MNPKSVVDTGAMPVILVQAEYKYIENGWSSARQFMEFRADAAPLKFENMEDYVRRQVASIGLDRLGEVNYFREEFAYRGVRQKGVNNLAIVYVNGEDGRPYVRFTLNAKRYPSSGFVMTSYSQNAEDVVSSLDDLAKSLQQSAEAVPFDKPMPGATEAIERANTLLADNLAESAVPNPG